MNQLEKLLQRAKTGEKIIIDQHFKQALKKKILENEQQGTDFPQKNLFWWKRLIIATLPLMVTIVLFFYYLEEFKHTSLISQQIETEQEGIRKDKQLSSVFTNRNGEGEQAPLPSGDILKTSPPISEEEAVIGISPEAEQTTPVNMGSPIGVLNSHPSQSAQETNPQKINPFPLLLGGILLLAICISVLFWYKKKKRGKKY
jgi:hypothetical protein